MKLKLKRSFWEENLSVSHGNHVFFLKIPSSIFLMRKCTRDYFEIADLSTNDLEDIAKNYGDGETIPQAVIKKCGSLWYLFENNVWRV